ncbi:efflux RND transporter permease subunit [candidate division KSB1 bacterium]
MFLTRIAINRPVTTAMFFLALSLLGVISWNKLPVQLTPNLTFPQISVQASMPNASPDQIEKELIIPIEGEIAKMEHIERITSVVRNGSGSVNAEFKLQANMKFVSLKLEQKINELSARLPENSRVNVGRNMDMAAILSNALMDVSIRGEGDVNSLRKFAEEKLKPELEKIDGVANVGVRGGNLREVQIEIEEYQARKYGINLNTVISRINAFNREKEFLGKIKRNNAINFVTISGQVTKLSELENIIINESIPLKLKDISVIKYGSQEEDRIYRINGRSTVGISLLKDNESNLLKTANNAVEEIERLNKIYEPEGLQIVVNMNAADFMTEAITNIEYLAISGAILSLLVLLVFLKNGRTVLAILLSIPISLLVTFNLMYYFGLTINVLSLIGLAIAVGMLVDNSIVVLENIFRHYELGKKPKEASMIGCSEVFKAIFASTLTTVAIFLPIVFLSDTTLIILKEIMLALIFPLGVSLIVAVTVIPSYAAQVLIRLKDFESEVSKRRSVLKKWQNSRIMELFTILLKARLRSPARTIILLTLLFVVTPVVTCPFMMIFEGVQEETQLPIYIETERGADLDATDRIALEVENIVDSLDFLKEFRTDVQPEEASVTLEFMNKDDRNNEELSLDDIRDRLESQTDIIPGGTIRYERISAGGRTGTGGGGGGDMGGGGGGMGGLGALFGSTDEIIRVKGYDQGTMKFVVESIMDRLRSFPEVNSRRVRSNLREGGLELQIWGDQKSMSQYNLTMRNIMSGITASQRQGNEMTTRFKDSDGEVVIRAKMIEKKERNIEELRDMSIPVPNVGDIPIENVSRIIMDEGRRSILRRDQERQIEIRYTFRDEYAQTQQDLEALRVEVDEAIHDIRLPRGFNLEIIHDEDNLLYTVMTRFLIGILIIYTILASTFESVKFPVIIFISIPMAITGSLWLLFFTGTSVQNPFALFSFLILLGIVVNNGIILIDYITILRKQHNFSRSRALLHASRARVRPILMTSITTILGVLPLAIWPNNASDMTQPFAISLIGGLSFATLLTLVYIPVLYLSIDDFINGMRRKGIPGVLIAIILNAGLVWMVLWGVQSLIYRILWIVIFTFALNAILWNVYNYLDRRKKKVIFGDDLFIRIRNLTKIYNEPSKFKKDFFRRTRIEDNLREKGVFKKDLSSIYENLIWKVPLFAFFIFVHYHFIDRTFRSGFWLFIMSASFYFLFNNVIKSIWYLIKIRKDAGNIPELSRRAKRFIASAKVLEVIAMFVYLDRLWNLKTGWTIFWCFMWLFIWYSRSITMRIYKGEVQVDKIKGWFKKIRKFFYRILLKIPGIGRKKIQVRALHGVDLEIRNGMFGLLGPNGAGKSTLMRLISNLFIPSRGEIYFNDYKLSGHRDFIQKFIGYLPQKFGLYGEFTAWNHLNYMALLNRWGNKNERHKLIESVLKNVNLWDRRNDKIKTFSGGMKQRVGVAQALLNLPRIIVVDEPTSGLDPRERIRFRNMLAEMSKNRIVIFSTHIVEDISTSCREVAVLNKGKVLFQGDPEDMRNHASGKVWEAEIPADSFTEWNRKVQIVSHMRKENYVKIKYISNKPAEDLETKPAEPTLEDAYLLMLNPI